MKIYQMNKMGAMFMMESVVSSIVTWIIRSSDVKGLRNTFVAKSFLKLPKSYFGRNEP